MDLSGIFSIEVEAPELLRNNPPESQLETSVVPRGQMTARGEPEEAFEIFSRSLHGIIELGRSKKSKHISSVDIGAGDGSGPQKSSVPGDGSKPNSESGIDISEEAPYDFRRDIKARLIKLKCPGSLDPNASSSMADILAPLVETVADKIFKGSFPDQQLSVHYLLDSKVGRFRRHDRHKRPNAAEQNAADAMALSTKSISEKDCPSDLRYYHIPVNNMSASLHCVHDH